MEEVELFKNGKRYDGRTVEELRHVKIKAHVLNDADGSAYLEWGNNKIIVGVYGPKECIPRHLASPYGAVVKCIYNMSPFSSLGEHGRSGPSRRSRELSMVIGQVFENVIEREKFPKAAIEIFVDVLQGDGGTRCAAVTAASVALADAGIPMKDMVSAVAVGKVKDTVVIDLDYVEDSQGQADCAIAFANRNKEVLLLQMEGEMSKEDMQKAFELASIAQERLHQLQVEALKEVYMHINEGDAFVDI
ncbi:exosome complex exonuclease Rrp41 [Candidatus Micrarchaeota archaeon]|nr:exosome complex exonuclease Rrp41 [Candidatus Micrarchaeota archaeon]